MGNKNTKYKDLDNNNQFGRLSNDGNNYIGNISNNVKNGKGTIEFSNGDIYEGDWINDEMHGKGKYQFENGDIYIGDMNNNYSHGKGEISYANGYSLKGTFCFNKISGNAVLYGLNKQKIYSGEYKNDVFHGEGKLYHEPGSKFYSGQFINGVCHGYGKLYNPEGKLLYSGGIINGEFEDEIDGKLIDEIFELIEDYNNFIFNGCLKNLEQYNSYNDNIPIVEATTIKPSAPNLEILCIICNYSSNLINLDCNHQFICNKCLIETQVEECFECGKKFNRNKYI